MMRYRVKTVTVPGMRVVHNFYPGPHDDPGRDRQYGADGFRLWITDEPLGERCHCGWNGGAEHYGTVAWVAEAAEGATR